MLKNTDINIRDPFIFPDRTENLYFMYGTSVEEAWKAPATGLDYYTSTDLESWDGPFPAFRPPANFWANQNFWAPEVHFYRGHYYMFVSFKSDDARRGTQILAADSPRGPFLPISDGPVTPRDWECLDGTLFVDTQNQPWIVFCHEWVQVGDGKICAMRLSENLESSVGEPYLLFHASEAPWAREFISKGRRGYVTDGPWMHRRANGDLLMLWSSFSTGDYTVGIAHSSSGDISGPWQQLSEPLYAGDGGHCMVFETFDGRTLLSYHRPNPSPQEHPHFTPLSETASSLELV